LREKNERFTETVPELFFRGENFFEESIMNELPVAPVAPNRAAVLIIFSGKPSAFTIA
jgi:hypothetical protein